MTEMFSLVEWIDEEKFSVIALSKIKEPKKALEAYKVEDIVKARCPGWPGVYNARLIAIRGNTTEDKLELERLTIECIDQHESSMENLGNGTPEKRKKKTTDKASPKKAKKNTDKENKEKKREEQLQRKEIRLKKNEEFLSSLEAFRKTVSQNQAPVLEEITTNQIQPNDEQATYLDLDAQQTANQRTTEEQSNPVHQWNQFNHNSHQFNHNSHQFNHNSHQFNHNSHQFNHNSHQFNHNSHQWNHNSHLSNHHTQLWNPTSHQLNNYSHQWNPQSHHSNSNSHQTNSNSDHWNHSDATPEPQACNECEQLREEVRRLNETVKMLEGRLRTSTGDSPYKNQLDGRPRAGVLPHDVAVSNHILIFADFRNTECEWFPRGLEIHPDGAVIACLTMSHWEKLTEYPTDSCVKRFEADSERPIGSFVTNEKCFGYPLRVSVNTRNEMAVFDYGFRCITLLNYYGEAIAKFNEVNDIYLSHRIALGCNRKDEFIVVQKIKPDVFAVKVDGSPFTARMVNMGVSGLFKSAVSAMAFDTQENMIVGSFYGVIKIFEETIHNQQP